MSFDSQNLNFVGPCMLLLLLLLLLLLRLRLRRPTPTLGEPISHLNLRAIFADVPLALN